jgi:hypothetical protein
MLKPGADLTGSRIHYWANNRRRQGTHRVTVLPAFVHAPTFKFRGTRDYVHSTDMYIELLAGANAAGFSPIDGIVNLGIRRRITTQPEFHFGVELEDKNVCPATFQLGTRTGVVFGAIVASNRPVVGRKPYDESPIWSEARVDGNRAEITCDTGLRPIEVVTALCTFQHRQMYPPPVEKRWLLARLSLVRPLRAQDARAVTISVDRTVGKSITRSTIRSPTERLGELDFILGSASTQPMTDKSSA